MNAATLEAPRPIHRSAGLQLSLASLLTGLVACGPMSQANDLTLSMEGADGSRSSVARAALRANDFIEGIGVCTHVDYLDTPYGEFSTVLKPQLQELGVRNIRTGLGTMSDKAWAGTSSRPSVRDRILNLRQTLGIRVMGTAARSKSTLDAAHVDNVLRRARELVAHDALLALEGVNEPNNGGTPPNTTPEATRRFTQDLFVAWNADPVLANLPVVGPSLNILGAQNRKDYVPALGDLSSHVDVGNTHPYPYRGKAPYRADRDYNFHEKWTDRVYPTGPMWVSEIGYKTRPGAGPYEASILDEEVQAKYILRIYLEYLQDPRIERVFLYQLLDQNTTGTDEGWGLVRADALRTPRPAFHALRDFIALLDDRDASFTPAFLGLSLETTAVDGTLVSASAAAGLNEGLRAGHPQGLAYHLNDLLLQKGDGRFYYIVWNNPRGWDDKTFTSIAATSVPVTLTFSSGIERVRFFAPYSRGVLEAQPTEWQPSAVNFSVPDHPVIVEVTTR